MSNPTIIYYHSFHKCVLSGEVELQYVPKDRQNADIFSKPLGLDKLWQFWGALRLRDLNVSNLRGREVSKDHDAESVDEWGATERKSRSH